MANVFGILTLLVLLISGFVAMKNKERYEMEISETNTQKNNLAMSQQRFEKARSDLADTIAKRNEVDAEVVTLTEEEATKRKNNENLEQQIVVKTRKAASNKEQLDDIRDKTAKIGDLKELASTMKATNAELEELAQNISATEAKLANLNGLNTQTEEQANAMKRKFEIISSGKSLPTLDTRIRSIYPTWGFVTLAAGNNGGVVANSVLDVVRGDATIARLLVTAVERGTASASIIPESVAQDTVLMVGDRVVPTRSGATPTAQ
jgi:DNA repair exonuclease SbcCD ATPase subunit